MYKCHVCVNVLGVWICVRMWSCDENSEAGDLSKSTPQFTENWSLIRLVAMSLVESSLLLILICLTRQKMCTWICKEAKFIGTSTVLWLKVTKLISSHYGIKLLWEFIMCMFPLCSGSSVAATTNCKLLPWIQWLPLLIAILTTLLCISEQRNRLFSRNYHRHWDSLGMWGWLHTVGKC